eukprot:2448649-Rhodomonas_salina.5
MAGTGRTLCSASDRPSISRAKLRAVLGRWGIGAAVQSEPEVITSPMMGGGQTAVWGSGQLQRQCVPSSPEDG